ncbi:hypothetical protein F5Y07DRAFT_257148 [Xylaria sp. FL0933]|nr:hypothetical protein F5Y07DRAFT_257148 [Xylaria sp. FL0933]
MIRGLSERRIFYGSFSFLLMLCSGLRLDAVTAKPVMRTMTSPQQANTAPSIFVDPKTKVTSTYFVNLSIHWILFYKTRSRRETLPNRLGNSDCTPCYTLASLLHLDGRPVLMTNGNPNRDRNGDNASRQHRRVELRLACSARD